MKIAFVGKGGSGKTTLSALFTSYLAESAQPVLTIDADINQHLSGALGIPDALVPPPLGAHLPLIKDYLRGSNPRISSAEAMLKTTPPGRGSRLLRFREDNPIYDTCVRNIAGIRFAVTGPFTEQDLGVACYHSKVGAVELLLNHLVDGPGEYVVVDMTAGADSFASGLFTRFDLTVLVCEPTVRGVSVYRQYLDYASDYGVQLAVIGNKICDEDDESFIREHVGEHLIANLGRSNHVRSMERGIHKPISELEPANRAALDTIKTTVDGISQDWVRYQQQAVEFHVKNAKAWGNEKAGEDLTSQIDPDFVLGTEAIPA